MCYLGVYQDFCDVVNQNEKGGESSKQNYESLVAVEIGILLETPSTSNYFKQWKYGNIS